MSIEANETWRPVVGYESFYEVSDLGRVRSLPRLVRHGGRCALDVMIKKGGRVLKPSDHEKGYLIVNLRGRTQLVHRLVLEAFRGPCPDGMEGCHFPDSTRTNCRLDNLRWDTRKSNHADKIVHGTSLRGERSPRAKLTNGCIDRIRDMATCGAMQKDIGALFGITQTHVSNLLSGKRWLGASQ